MGDGDPIGETDAWCGSTCLVKGGLTYTTSLLGASSRMPMGSEDCELPDAYLEGDYERGR